MGSLAIPKCGLESKLVKNIDPNLVTAAPLLFVKIDGVTYANGFKFNTGGGFRLIFPSYDSATGNVYLNSYTFAVNGTVPSWSAYDVEVLLID